MNVSNPPHQWDEEAQETVVGNAQTLQFLQQKSVEEIAFVQQRLVNHETSQSDAVIPLLERLLRFNVFRRDGVCVASMGKGGRRKTAPIQADDGEGCCEKRQENR